MSDRLWKDDLDNLAYKIWVLFGGSYAKGDKLARVELVYKIAKVIGK